MHVPSDGRIDILLATYNGEHWLPAQLASIAAQTHTNWRLIARDDGSADETPSILRDFQRKHPEKTEIVSDDLGHLKTLGNFEALMKVSTADYCTFSDQDDVWDEDKLEASFAAMRELVAEHGVDTPLMVVSDRRVVDEQGETLSESLWRTNGFVPDAGTTLFDLVAYPICAGSTMLMNAALRSRSLPIPAEANQYDCWIELVAPCFGKVRFVDRPLLSHIRHETNMSGFRSYSSRRYLRRAASLLTRIKAQKRVYGGFIVQARAFLTRHGDDMSVADRRRLEEFVALKDAGPFRRIRYLLSGGPLPPTIERKLAFILIV